MHTASALTSGPYALAGGNREFAAWQAWRDFNALMHRHSGCGHTQPCPLEARRAAAAGASTSSSTGGHRPHAWMRARTLAPGSHISKRFFAAHPTVLQVGSTVFAHGGILPSHVKYGLEQMNK